MATMSDLLITVISGAVACIAGFIVSLLSGKLSIQKKDSEKLINRIIQVAGDNMAAANQSPEKSNSIGNLIEELISGYHRQALIQAGIQFYFSLLAAAVGFGIIIYTVLTRATSDEFEMVLKSLPGIAISSVATLFVKQVAETRQRATELYDRLRADNKLNEAIALINSIEDVKIKSVVKAQIAMSMVGLQYDPISMNDLMEELSNIDARTTKIPKDPMEI